MGGPGGMRRAPGRDLGRGQGLGRSLLLVSRTPARGAADRFAHSAGPYHLTCGVGWLVGCLVGWLVGVGWVGWLVGRKSEKMSRNDFNITQNDPKINPT